MAIDPDALLAWRFDDVVQRYDERDCILYALALGIGSDPIDRAQLRHVHEDGLVPFPTMPVVLAHPGFWLQDPRTGVDWRRAVAAEQSIVVHRPLPARGTVVGRMSVTGLHDKGAGKGALLAYRRDLHEAATGTPLCSVEGATFLRGDGGFARGAPGAGPAAIAAPDRPPDASARMPTLPQAALLYRLTGDMNPLHADPDAAARAGFARPILHGLCSWGIACRAVCAATGRRPDALRRFAARFSAPVFPGETLVADVWTLGDGELAFRCRVEERGVAALTHGRARFADAGP